MASDSMRNRVILSFLPFFFTSALVFALQKTEVTTINGEDGAFWWVQISDIHVSTQVKSRADDLEDYFSPFLQLVQPALVLLTGDLTDAKVKGRILTRQNREEWLRYAGAIKAIAKRSGLREEFFLDLRGNHDTYLVPSRNGSQDYFSRCSNSGRFGKAVEPVQDLTIVGPHGAKVIFVGLDASPEVGLRRPSNFFGHPSDKSLQQLDEALSKVDVDTPNDGFPPLKVVFAHYPLAFMAQSPSGARVEEVLKKRSVDVFVAGHLHALFGLNTYRLHVKSPHTRSAPISADSPLKRCESSTHLISERNANSRDQMSVTEGLCQSLGFWELVAKDWKDSRYVRIMAADQGRISFVDVKLLERNKLSWKTAQAEALSGATGAESPPTAVALQEGALVLLLSPPDTRFRQLASRSLLAGHPPLEVRALVFSTWEVVTVIAQIYGDSGELLNQVPLTTISKNDALQSLPRRLYKAPFPDLHDKAGRFWIEIAVNDSEGRVTVSSKQPFSLANEATKLEQSWLEYTLLNFSWDAVLPFTIGFAILALLVTIVLPRTVLSVLVHQDMYATFCTWALTDRMLANGHAPFEAGLWPLLVSAAGIGKLLIWVYVDSAGSQFWWCQLACLGYLTVGPWFWGWPLGSHGGLGQMSLLGWRLFIFEQNGHRSGLANPDIVTITLPFLVMILPPTLLMGQIIFQERKLARHIKQKRTDAPAKAKKYDGEEEATTPMHNVTAVRQNQDRVTNRPGTTGGHEPLTSSSGSAAQQADVDRGKVLEKRKNPGVRRKRFPNLDIAAAQSAVTLLRLIAIFIGAPLLYYHYLQCKYVADAFGVVSLVMSPGFAWLPFTISGCACWLGSRF